MEAKNRAQIARESLWKVPQMQIFGFADMQSKLSEMGETIADVVYTWDEDVGTILNAVDDDEDLVREFQFLCSDVQDHLESVRQMFTKYTEFRNASLSDLMTKTERAELTDNPEDAQYTTCRAYDDCTVALLGKRFRYSMSGFDPSEQDFFELDDYDEYAATEEAKKRLKRLTKEQIMDLVGTSVAILLTFNDFRVSYERFMATYEILTGTNQATMEAIAQIDRLYDVVMAAKSKPHWSRTDKEKLDMYRFDQVLEHIPPRMWVE